MPIEREITSHRNVLEEVMNAISEREQAGKQATRFQLAKLKHMQTSNIKNMVFNVATKTEIHRPDLRSQKWCIPLLYSCWGQCRDDMGTSSSYAFMLPLVP